MSGDTNTDTDTNINSYLIQLEALEGQYRTKLTEYESAYTTYISALQDQTTNPQSNSYVVLPGQTYSGTGSISNTPNSSISMCEAACSANTSCTGASFNSINMICKLRSGNSVLTPGATSDNAIITSIRAKIINLETLNNQLITINGQITDLYNQMNSQVTVQTGTLSTNGDNLSTQYSLLMDEKIKIKNLLDEYNNIDNSNIDQTIVVDQQNSSYYLWLIICIISIILVIKFIAFPDSKGNLISVISWTSIFICITLATLHLNNPAAYAIWLILIVLVLMMKSELIPSI